MRYQTAILFLFYVMLSTFIMLLHCKKCLGYYHIAFTSLSFLPIFLQVCFLYRYFTSKTLFSKLLVSSVLAPHPKQES